MIESRRVTVAYHGGSSGSGPLSLGQDNMIRCTLNVEPEDINKQGAWPVPPGADVDAVLAALRMLVERHESLRTRYSGPAGGQPTAQHVQAAGSFEVDLVQTDEAPAEVADRIGRANRGRRFDVNDEFPLRLALITVAGRPVLLSVVVCHAAADGRATALLLDEWYALASGAELPPPTSKTPREVAESERTPAGARRVEASLRHWDRILDQGPHAVFADDTIGPSEGLLTTLVVQSAKAAADLEAVSRRVGATPSTVILAAYAALAAHRSAQQTVVIAALAANRHRRGYADHIGTLAQDALIRLDTATGDFDQLVAATNGAVMTGYWHSTFDSARIWRLIDDAAHRRGARFARHLVVNDLSSTVPDVVLRDVPAPPEDPQILRIQAEPIPSRLMFTIWRLAGSVAFTLHADAQLFPGDEPERLAAGLLKLIEAAATETVPLERLGELTGLAPARREGEWERIAGSWIDMAAVRDLLDVALDKRPVRLGVEDGRLTAAVGDAAGTLTPEAAHQAVMDVLFHHSRGVVLEPGRRVATGELVNGALSGWETAIAPQRYVIHSGAPRDVGDPGAWAELAVVGAGGGRSGGDGGDGGDGD